MHSFAPHILACRLVPLATLLCVVLTTIVAKTPAADMGDDLRSKGPAPRTTVIDSSQDLSFSAAPAGARIVVSYDGFTPQAEAAFERAVAAWERALVSPVKIRVQASFTAFDNPAVLGGARPSRAIKSEDGLWRPSALADVEAGRDVTPGEPDIVAQLSADYPRWHFGSGPAPRGASDFTSVVLHELAHGLGFTGAIVSDGDGTIAWGFGRSEPAPGVFDKLITDEEGAGVVGTYANGSRELADVLTGGALTWGGRPVDDATGPIELFAPPAWQQGSSVYHLDEDAYPAGTDGSLMTPALYDGETIRTPGRLTICLLADLGWEVAEDCGQPAPTVAPRADPSPEPSPSAATPPQVDPSPEPSPVAPSAAAPPAEVPAPAAPPPSAPPAGAPAAVVPAAGVRPTSAGPFVDGDPATTDRVPYPMPDPAAVAISQERFGAGEAAHAVLSRDDDYPDSLAGAALTGAGPLLLTPAGRLDAAVARELARALPDGATVYLLGGEQALAPAVADAVTALGLVPRRLAGSSRVETSVAVAREVRRLYGGEVAALARAYPTGSASSGWADAVTAGAWAAATGAPILVTEPDGAHAEVAAWLAEDAPSQTVLLGGRAALSKSVVTAVPGPRRVSGRDRSGTAAAIATELFDGTADTYVLIDGYRADGWAFGLAGAGLAADLGAPLLVVGDDVPDATSRVLSSCAAPPETLVVGDASVVSEAVVQTIEARERSCG